MQEELLLEILNVVKRSETENKKAPIHLSYLGKTAQAAP